MGLRFKPDRDVEVTCSSDLRARARTEQQRIGNTMVPLKPGNECVHRRNVAQPGGGTR